MDFLSFTDTEYNFVFGKGCYESFFDAVPGFNCYSPLRPIGHVLYFSVPHFFTAHGDTINAIYLGMNLAFFFLAMLSLKGIITLCYREAYGESPPVALPLAFIIAAALFIGHVPIILMDLPPCALALYAVWLSLRAFIVGDAKRPDPAWATFWIALLVAFAGLLKQSYFVMGGMALLLAVAVCGYRQRWDAQQALKVGMAGTLGGSLIVLQLWHMWEWGGVFWFYDAAAVELSHGKFWEYPYTKMVPWGDKTAYILQAVDIGLADWWLYKWRIATFLNELAVYKSAPSDPDIFLTADELGRGWSLFGLAAIVALTLHAVARRSSALLLLVSLYAASTTFMLMQSHVELRFFLFPKALLYSAFAVVLLHAFALAWGAVRWQLRARA